MINEFFLRAAIGLAPAPDGAPDSEGHGYILLLFYMGLFAVFYFFLIRPQSKRTKEVQKMQEALNKGDWVVTQGGIYGTVHKIKGKVVTLEIAEDVRIKLQRSAISDRLKESETENLDD